jgi:DNA-binding NarL/FixJ family response regulator
MAITSASVLVIEKYPLMRAALCAALAAEPDFQVAEPEMEGKTPMLVALSDRQEAPLIASRPDLILLALGYPGYEELKALKGLRKSLPDQQ